MTRFPRPERGIRRRLITRGTALAVLAILPGLGATEGLAQTTAERATRLGQASSSDIRDTGGLFGADAIAGALKELQQFERQTGAAVRIETIDTLEGESASEAAIQRARRSGIEGLFILIVRKEHKLENLAHGPYRRALTESRREAIQRAFSEGFRRQDFNEGLRRGVAAIREVLGNREVLGTATARREESRPQVGEAHGAAGAATPGSSGAVAGAASPLLARNQVRLTLAGARAILAGAEAKAQAMGRKMNIAVVDDGGHLLSFERMDGARPASGYTAITKATTAATLRQPSGPLPAGTTSPDPLLNISLQNAAMASGGKLTTLYGGVPVVVDGQVIGGVGVGGGSGEEDAQVARAGIQAFLDQIATPPADSGPRTPPGSAPPTSQRDGAASKGDDSSF
jgi:glc operon protein GlcG